jgi:serine/threonine-protein kinase
MTGGAESANREGIAVPGAVIASKYTLLHLVGPAERGLWLARCAPGRVNTEPVVALQLVRTDADTPPEGMAAAFEAEMRQIARLERPNLSRLLDYGTDANGTMFATYEWPAAGRTLAQVIRDEWPLSKERISSIVLQLLAALESVHRAGFAHGDLGPWNIMLRGVPEQSSEQLVLHGLGLAVFAPFHFERSAPAHLTQITAEWVIGDPEYLAPEQLMGEPPGVASDLYGVGVLLFQLLTGSVPFSAETAYEVAFRQRFTLPEPPSTRVPVNSLLEAICLRALSKTPELRFHSAALMRNALLEARSMVERGTGLVRHSSPLAFERARTSLARVSRASIVPAFRAEVLSAGPVETKASPAPPPKRILAPLLIAGAVALTALIALPSFEEFSFESEPADGRGVESAPPKRVAATRMKPPEEHVVAIPLPPLAAEQSRARAEPVTLAQSVPASAAESEQPQSGPEPMAPVEVAIAPPHANEPPADAPRTSSPLADALRGDAPPVDGEPAGAPLGAATPTTSPHADETSLESKRAEAKRPASPATPRASPPRADVSRITSQRADASHGTASRADAARSGGQRADLPRAALPANEAPAPKQTSAAGTAQLVRVTPSMTVAQADMLLPMPSAAEVSAARTTAGLPPTAATAAPIPVKASTAPVAPQPSAAAAPHAFSVEFGQTVTSRGSVSKGALRGALNPEVLARCYRDAVAPVDAPAVLNATLELTTDLAGRVRVAQLRGSRLAPALVECVESHARRFRVREGDSGGAMQAAIALTFRAQ